MKWYKDSDQFSSDERMILTILTMNEDPKKIWIKYRDVLAMSNVSEYNFNISIQSLINQRLIRIGDQGKGLSIALEEKIEWMMDERLDEVIQEIEIEIQEAIEKGDLELADELQKIVDKKKK